MLNKIRTEMHLLRWLYVLPMLIADAVTERIGSIKPCIMCWVQLVLIGFAP